jgi:hypothetical protein
LNKYFVANEKIELLNAFSVPPNIFDSYITAGEKENEENINKLKEAGNQLEESGKKLAAETARSRKLQDERDCILLESKRLAVRLAEKRGELQNVRANLLEAGVNLACTQGERDDLRTRGQQLQAETGLLRAETGLLYARIAELDLQIHLLRSSTSWRITRPIRALRMGCRNFLLKHKSARKAWLKVRPFFAGLWHTIRR